MLIRIIFKYCTNIDIFVCFSENYLNLKHLYAFTYFVFNFFIGLCLGELTEILLISLVKKSTTHFLGIPLGINKLKISLDEPSNFKYSNNIKEICVQKNIILLSSKEPNYPTESVSSTSSSNPSTRRNSLSPFSRPVTPILNPLSRPASPILSSLSRSVNSGLNSFSHPASPSLNPSPRSVSPNYGPGESDPAINPHNLPNTPLRPQDIYPEFFRQEDARFTDACSYLDTVIQAIVKATYNVIGPS